MQEVGTNTVEALAEEPEGLRKAHRGLREGTVHSRGSRPFPGDQVIAFEDCLDTVLKHTFYCISWITGKGAFGFSWRVE